jgi:hypothetical protein
MASLLSVMGVASGKQRRELPMRCVGDDHGERAGHPRLVVAHPHPAPAATSGAPADPTELTQRAAAAVARLSAALDAATACSFLHALRRGPLRETLDALIEDCERFVFVVAPDAIQSGDSAALRMHARRMAAAVYTLDMSAEEGTRLPDTAHGVQRARLRSALGDKDVQRAVVQLAELFTALANAAMLEPSRPGASVPLRASLSRLGRPGALIAGALAALSLVAGNLAYSASSAASASDSQHGVRLSSLSLLSSRARALLPIHDRDASVTATDGENLP